MKVLFMISHPAHFHMFRYTITTLQNDGHKTVIIIRPKDVLEQLCINAGMHFLKVKNRPKKWGLLGLGVSLIEKTIEVSRIVRREKPDMLIGSDGVLAYAGFLNRVPSFEWFEDDVSIIKLYANLFFPFYTNIVSPTICNAGKWDYKKVSYSGYQKLAYLHPKFFSPKKEVVEKYFLTDRPYFILRFAQLTAHHDQGVHGFTTDIAKHVIDLLSPYGRIYISSEKRLPENFEPYRLQINPLDIHHVLAFATIYLGDSQSMAVESCMLGVPAIRFNDFVDKKRISVLEELEHQYKLTYAIPSSNPERLYSIIKELLAYPNLRDEWATRRERMLSEKINVTTFYVWFIENYPKSVEIMRDNPNYQWQFR